MCGIVAAVAQRNVVNILLEGLRRLEYRGYDSAGLAVASADKILVRKTTGKVNNLENALQQAPIDGYLGIAHTRWATHGKPTQSNAHPHASNTIAIVHNGIIENHDQLRKNLQQKNYHFASQTDTEVIAHLIDDHIDQGQSLLQAVNNTTALCEGAYALAVIDSRDHTQMIATRKGSPLVIGVGIGENFIASDQLALRQVTDRFIYLEEGDIAEVSCESVTIYDNDFQTVSREQVQITGSEQTADRGDYRHFMLKEIYEQPQLIAQSLQGRLGKQQVLENCFGVDAKAVFDRVEHITIVACGTSYHAGLAAKHWLEAWANIACTVEIASEYRYRKLVVPKQSLFVALSQSGETADTLAALRKAKKLGYLSFLAICNVPNSSLVRESALSLMIQAGVEIGVASTKAFTAQLVALQLLTIVVGRRHGLTADKEADMVDKLRQLPELCRQALTLDPMIQQLSEQFIDKNHALFLGRGIQYSIALEGALKLKELSYIHAEAYPAGELKHGPLALVDNEMPIVAVAPNDELIDKLKSNLEEVHARGGQLYIFADTEAQLDNTDNFHIIQLPKVPYGLAAIVFTLPLQLLSYHVAVLKGTDVDQPRNLAKSVTVE
ncbi:MAG: glutamine--fructose-6-phosphate transaminase (isomerizing) [Cellvibrionaceae bacterium]|nr:glutamine--fructose-6-phosphate transaminase (isomerizing) [Cellvibrionaceae bacterium]